MQFYSKNGVQVHGLQPEALFGMCIVASVFHDSGQRFTVTSVRDGVHKNGSLHYDGYAFDIRIHDLRGIHSHVIASRLQEALGSQFQVIPEADHIHVEFDYGQA